MLNHRELREDLRVEHLDHPLVDLAPTILDAGDIEQYRAVLPERSLLDVVDEANGAEVHIRPAVSVYLGGLDNGVGLGGTADGALGRHGLAFRDRPSELRRAEYIGDEAVVIQTPDTVRTCRFESVCENQAADDFQVPEGEDKH